MPAETDAMVVTYTPHGNTGNKPDLSLEDPKELKVSANLISLIVSITMVKEMFQTTCAPPTVNHQPQLAHTLVKVHTMWPIKLIYTSEPVLTMYHLMLLQFKLKS